MKYKVFKEILRTITEKPDEAKKVNSTYLFLIKKNNKPTKRWGEYV